MTKPLQIVYDSSADKFLPFIYVYDVVSERSEAEFNFELCVKSK